jgi:uncharacterized coiled-coil DUF342 family protein
MEGAREVSINETEGYIIELEQKAHQLTKERDALRTQADEAHDAAQSLAAALNAAWEQVSLLQRERALIDEALDHMHKGAQRARPRYWFAQRIDELRQALAAKENRG